MIPPSSTPITDSFATGEGNKQTVPAAESRKIEQALNKTKQDLADMTAALNNRDQAWLDLLEEIAAKTLTKIRKKMEQR
jgi:hypothetical protein